ARVPDFRLVERSGREVSRRSLVGEVWVADFIFTRCQWSCPKMCTLMDDLRRHTPGAKFVSFTVDPEHDTAEVLRGWVATHGVDQPEWSWLTGKSREELQKIAEGFLIPVGRVGPDRMEILHSSRLVLVDRYGRIRGRYAVVDDATLERRTEEMRALQDDLLRVMAEPFLPVTRLPAVNAALNATTFVLLLAGVGFIAAKKVGAHKGMMLAALSVSGLFLVSYLTTHYYLGSTPYPHHDGRRPVYFTILISHTILAAVVAVLAPLTVYRAFRGQLDRHRRVAKVTLPLWLYVSVTGVVIYFMLYGGGLPA
ncbi:MAG TPA: DUF420 domain-containing protein, partial [Planctomycetota bacterium]|nr:DUF420 domain-containing protein [Planctomycetota bacterium]